MDKSNVVEFAGRDGIVDPMTELLRTGAEQLIYQAVEGELQELLARHTERRLCDGRAGVVRNGYLPAYVRKTKRLEGALPWLYLKGVSSGEMEAALEVLVGPQAKGLSASTVSRLKQVWGQEYRSWSEERLDKDHWVYVWADGVYSGLRAEHTKLCALVGSG